MMAAGGLGSVTTVVAGLAVGRGCGVGGGGRIVGILLEEPVHNRRHIDGRFGVWKPHKDRCLAAYRLAHLDIAADDSGQRRREFEESLARLENRVVRALALTRRIRHVYDDANILIGPLHMGKFDECVCVGKGGRLVRRNDQNGVDVADLELRAPTLDDVFLAKTGRTLEGATEEAESDVKERRG